VTVETPEQRFDRIKQVHEQQQLLSSVGPAPVTRGPWLTLCGEVGPYAIKRPTAKNVFRLEVLRCTRPHGHGGTFHQYSEPERGPIAQWDRSGHHLWPPVVDPAARSPKKEGE